MSEPVADNKTVKEQGKPNKDPETVSTTEEKVVPLATFMEEKKRRQELESKLMKFDDEVKKRELEKLEKDGKLQELVDKYKTDYTTLDSKYSNLESEYNAKVKELTDLIQQQKELVINKLPANLKPSDDLISKMSVKDLNEYYDGLVKAKVVTDKTLNPVNGKEEKADIAKYYKNRINTGKY